MGPIRVKKLTRLQLTCRACPPENQRKILIQGPLLPTSRSLDPTHCCINHCVSHNFAVSLLPVSGICYSTRTIRLCVYPTKMSDCSDSTLSTTANILGIFTFAITLLTGCVLNYSNHRKSKKRRKWQEFRESLMQRQSYIRFGLMEDFVGLRDLRVDGTKPATEGNISHPAYLYFDHIGQETPEQRAQTRKMFRQPNLPHPRQTVDAAFNIGEDMILPSIQECYDNAMTILQNIEEAWTPIKDRPKLHGKSFWEVFKKGMRRGSKSGRNRNSRKLVELYEECKSSPKGHLPSN